ncbi:hypothetical protein [Streptomyces sp. B3I8]|uniref:hypothetical protein n=1 Tax=Streptomyces sp. B3I8 TaxID=3042303 RepID=UPI0027841D20|nr:hypothetical protein [Streptomyces sp. B3I8]MDQ0785054.1 hypothetical protein [Streptomyces sp. B3I8]
MIHHTMIVAFDSPIPASELEQYLKEFEELVAASGLIETCVVRPHLRVPGDDHAPVAVADAIVQLGVSDLDALEASFAMPGVGEFIGRWQARHPYKAIWANHEPLA